VTVRVERFSDLANRCQPESTEAGADLLRHDFQRAAGQVSV